MGNKGKTLAARGKTQPKRIRECQKGLHNKLSGIRKHSSVRRLDNRPDPFQKQVAFAPAERTDGFKYLSNGGWTR